MSTIIEHRPVPESTTRADVLVRWLATHSIDILRVCLGLVMVGFGVLKFFPGVSPVQSLVTRTVDILTLGVVSGQSAMVATAAIECVIGLALVTGKFPRITVLALAGCVLGWLSPLVLFPGDLFADGGPTLTAQYIAKDIVLGAEALVLAAKAFGARLAVGPAADDSPVD